MSLANQMVWLDPASEEDEELTVLAREHSVRPFLDTLLKDFSRTLEFILNILQGRDKEMDRICGMLYIYAVLIEMVL